MQALTVLAQLRFFSAINGITQNGPSNGGQMDPYLVGAPCFKAALQVCIPRNRSNTRQLVTALLAFLSVTAIFFLSDGLRPIGASIRPESSFMPPQTTVS